jgi:hypothetical protein
MMSLMTFGAALPLTKGGARYFSTNFPFLYTYTGIGFALFPLEEQLSHTRPVITMWRGPAAFTAASYPFHHADFPGG